MVSLAEQYEARIDRLERLNDDLLHENERAKAIIEALEDRGTGLERALRDEGRARDDLVEQNGKLRQLLDRATDDLQR